MRRQRRTRGQAAVELAVSMLVIVPTFMYILFIDDMLRAKLDLEEAVMTAPWEYARVNYEEGAASTGTRAGIRLSWCDHTTAYNSYDRAYDCTESVHHVALAAHQCWLTQGAKQVTCSDPLDSSYGKLDATTSGLSSGSVSMGLGLSKVQGDYIKGGLVRCSARLGVINYYLPNKLFTEFTDQEMTRTKEYSGDVHAAAATGITFEQHYLLEEQQAGLVVDDMALDNPMQKIDSGGSGHLKDRVNAIYGPYFAQAFIKGESFYQKILSSDVLNAGVLTDAIGDDPHDANVAFDPDNGAPFNEGLHGSPWFDQNRGDHYMGQQDPPQ
jgi:hypothetical protein